MYCEKPVAETADECRPLVEAQRASGKIFAVGFNRRMAPAYQLARKIFAAHGGPKNIYYRISDAYWMWGRNYPPRTRIVHEACHIFDILRYLTGSDSQSIYCIDSRPDDETFSMKFGSGCIATVLSSGYLHFDMPKEYMEAVVDIGAITVNDFCELRTFGLADFEPVYRFLGHTHPDRDHIHRYLLARQGAAAMYDIRRICYEGHIRLETLRQENADTPERRELEHFQTHHVPNANYMAPKGWVEAIEHLSLCILNGTPCELAGAEDALAVARIIQAGMRSRETGEPVRLTSDC